MNIKKLIAAVAASIIMITGLAACSSVTPAETVAPPDYAEITARIKEYEDSYRDFVQTGVGGVNLVTSSGFTPLGATCSAKYTVTEDGVYESCSLVVQRDVEQYDEYFNIGDDMMMFVRSYIDTAGLFVLNKYICYPDAVYYINDETQTLDLVTDVESLDCFVTFDQVRRVYGAPEEGTEG